MSGLRSIRGRLGSLQKNIVNLSKNPVNLSNFIVFFINSLGSERADLLRNHTGHDRLSHIANAGSIPTEEGGIVRFHHDVAHSGNLIRGRSILTGEERTAE